MGRLRICEIHGRRKNPRLRGGLRYRQREPHRKNHEEKHHYDRLSPFLRRAGEPSGSRRRGVVRLRMHYLSPDSKNGFAVWPSYADLASKEPKDIYLVDRISGTTKSGHRSKYLRRTSSGEQNAKTDTSKESSLGEQDLGIEASLESVIPVEHYIDTNLDFRWQGQLRDHTTLLHSHLQQCSPALRISPSWSRWPRGIVHPENILS